MSSVGSHMRMPWFIALCLGLGACGLATRSKTCKLKAGGLLQEGYNGSSLSDLQLSLVFLKGPSEISESLGDALKDAGIVASFFAKGEAVKEHESSLDKLKDAGHVIGTGGYSFQSLRAAEDPVLELRAADAAITDFTIGSQFFLYGEHDSMGASARQQLLRAGLGKYVGPIYEDTASETFIDDERCWELGLSVSACAQGYMERLQDIRRGIVAFHDEDPRSDELLRELLPQMSAFGFTFARLDQIPDIRIALGGTGAKLDATAADASCNDYE